MIVRKFGGSRLSTSFGMLSTLVFALLVVLLAALFSLFAVKNDGNDESYMQFTEYADRIAENFNNRLHADLLALDSFSISSTSYALDAKHSWPMVTLPDFAIRSWTTRQEMGAETLGILPIVPAEKRQEWEDYVMDNHKWIEEARVWEDKEGKNANPNSRLLHEDTPISSETVTLNRNLQQEVNFSDGVASNIYTVNMNGTAVVDEGMGPFTPIWMTSPAPRDPRMINFNMLSHHLFWQAIEDCMYSRLSVLSRVLNFESIGSSENFAGSSAQIIEEPISSIFYPVFDQFEENKNVVGILAAEIYWHSLFENSQTDIGTEVVCVVETACDQIFSFKMDGHKAVFLGVGDHHDPKLSNMVQTRGPKALIEKAEGFTGTPIDIGHCPFLLHVYPASEMKGNHSPAGIISFVSCLLASVILIIMLSIYYNDFSTELKEIDVENTKVHSIPRQSLRRRIISAVPKLRKKRQSRNAEVPQRARDVIRSMPEGITSSKSTETTILTNATLMVAGICALEKWGEEKEPKETTHLLETVHQSLIVVAKRHGVTQVEMIDGNFLAIVGSNDSDVDHAAILVRFACECRKRVSELFKSMSAKELSIRFGIHSGNMKPDMSCIGDGNNRFQLFGDTVDIAYQMLDHGKANRIHVSVDTAELLNLSGKSNWVSPRSDLVPVKMLGNMCTFWVKPKACLSTAKANQIPNCKNDVGESTSSSLSARTNWEDSCSLNDVSEKEFESLVDQNTAILLRYLRAIYARRLASKQNPLNNIASSWESDIEIGSSIIEEAREMVQPASFDFKVSMNQVDPSLTEIPSEVQSQLRVYVASIGTAYHQENPFHNFQHASHTVLSIDQMIKKITSTSNIMLTGFDGIPRTKGDIAEELDEKTFSIYSDPIIQFSMVFSALVHDVDHMGVSNQQLIKNGSPLASLYKKRCISEQNSVDISWWLLMTADFDDLRSAIYSNSMEKRRFRQVIVNSVIATDVLDSKMKQHRDNNWNKVFAKKAKSNRLNYMEANEKRNIQVTSIIECVAQVADLSYRGQSYLLYKKWNERLFKEACRAYQEGRLEENPALNWYKSELNYFDNFLIPSLSRLSDTGVFGGSGESYLTQALDNRNAWKVDGEVMVQDMADRFSRSVVAAQEDTIHFS